MLLDLRTCTAHLLSITSQIARFKIFLNTFKILLDLFHCRLSLSTNLKTFSKGITHFKQFLIDDQKHESTRIIFITAAPFDFFGQLRLLQCSDPNIASNLFYFLLSFTKPSRKLQIK